MTILAHFLLLILNILKYIPIFFLQILIFSLILPILISHLLFNHLTFFKRAKTNYNIACKAYLFKPIHFFSLQYSWNLAYIFAQLPSIWLQKKIPIDLSRAENVNHHLSNNQQGALIIAAHLSSFEVIPRAILKMLEMHPEKKFYAFYKKPHIKALDPLIQGLRKNINSDRYINVPANLGGVKVLLKALKEKHVVAMVVDQTPQAKAGTWLKWFGVNAYTSSLVYQLASKAQAQIFITDAMYHKQKRSWQIKATPLKINDDEQQSMLAINHELEALIMEKPMQYLWGYNRYKDPN